MDLGLRQILLEPIKSVVGFASGRSHVGHSGLRRAEQGWGAAGVPVGLHAGLLASAASGEVERQ